MPGARDETIVKIRKNRIRRNVFRTGDPAEAQRLVDTPADCAFADCRLIASIDTKIIIHRKYENTETRRYGKSPCLFTPRPDNVPRVKSYMSERYIIIRMR